MAGGRERVAERERERRRDERQQAKRIRREALAASTEAIDADERQRMDEFQLLSERHADGGTSDATYAAERERMFGELGIDVPDM